MVTTTTDENGLTVIVVDLTTKSMFNAIRDTFDNLPGANKLPAGCQSAIVVRGADRLHIEITLSPGTTVQDARNAFLAASTLTIQDLQNG